MNETKKLIGMIGFLLIILCGLGIYGRIKPTCGRLSCEEVKKRGERNMTLVTGCERAISLFIDHLKLLQMRKLSKEDRGHLEFLCTTRAVVDQII